MNKLYKVENFFNVIAISVQKAFDKYLLSKQ